ncbi:hypothetical protein HK102_005122, partial [Quaeritorhiza haematococci]
QHYSPFDTLTFASSPPPPLTRSPTLRTQHSQTRFPSPPSPPPPPLPSSSSTPPSPFTSVATISNRRRLLKFQNGPRASFSSNAVGTPTMSRGLSGVGTVISALFGSKERTMNFRLGASRRIPAGFLSTSPFAFVRSVTAARSISKNKPSDSFRGPPIARDNQKHVGAPSRQSAADIHRFTSTINFGFGASRYMVVTDSYRGDAHKTNSTATMPFGCSSNFSFEVSSTSANSPPIPAFFASPTGRRNAAEEATFTSTVSNTPAATWNSPGVPSFAVQSESVGATQNLKEPRVVGFVKASPRPSLEPRNHGRKPQDKGIGALAAIMTDVSVTVKSATSQRPSMVVIGACTKESELGVGDGLNTGETPQPAPSYARKNSAATTASTSTATAPSHDLGKQSCEISVATVGTPIASPAPSTSSPLFTETPATVPAPQLPPHGACPLISLISQGSKKLPGLRRDNAQL